jgi:hypothetical protein
VSLLKPVAVGAGEEADEGKEVGQEENEGVFENSRHLISSGSGSGDGVRGIIWSCFNVSAIPFNQHKGRARGMKLYLWTGT